MNTECQNYLIMAFAKRKPIKVKVYERKMLILLDNNCIISYDLHEKAQL